MSDTPLGPGWWQASDGRWYPPDAIPEPPKLPKPPTLRDEMAAGGVPRWIWYAAAVLGAGILVLVLALVVTESSDQDRPRVANPAPVPTLTPPIPGYRSSTTTVQSASTTQPPRHERTCPGALVEIRYYVDGEAPSGSVTMDVGDGVQQADVELPMTNRDGGVGVARCGRRGDFVYVSVQNRHETGSVSCSIVVDGEVVAQNSSIGAYVIATCSGSA